MSWECSRCHRRLLDDSCAYYKKLYPERYVAHYLVKGCDSASCPDEPAWSIPADDKIRWVKPVRLQLQGPGQLAKWTETFLRHNVANLPTSIRTIWSKCKDLNNIVDDTKLRWAIEEPTGYVASKPHYTTYKRRSSS
jgi:hypothetical protein